MHSASICWKLPTDAPSVKGSVFDGRNTIGDDIPVQNYVVVVYPQAREERGWRSRRITVVRPDIAGLFHSRPLPPGQYRALALQSLRPGEEYDPSFLDAADATADSFSLTKGMTTQLRIRLSRMPSR